MSKAFTKMGKEIAIAVKEGGAHQDTNPRLRAAIQNAKAVNMPKDRIEAAIKRATEKGEKNFEEVVYEGYGPYGVAIVVETATDNPTRTVANIRMYFNRAEGSLGKTGSLDFLFERKGIFRISAEGQNKEELELQLIDFGADEIREENGEIVVYTDFTNTGSMQKALEDAGITIKTSEIRRIPKNTVELSEEQQEQIYELIEKFEEDEDVQEVFHNMKEEED